MELFIKFFCFFLKKTQEQIPLSVNVPAFFFIYKELSSLYNLIICSDKGMLRSVRADSCHSG